MKTYKYDPINYTRVRDIPYLLWLGVAMRNKPWRWAIELSCRVIWKAVKQLAIPR